MKKFITIFTCLFSLTLWAQTPKEVYKEAQAGKAVIIDVREQSEIADGMVKGAKWLPLSKIKQDKNWYKKFKKMAGDKKAYVYCKSGHRAGIVQNMLKEHGTKAVNFGGFMTLGHELPTQKGK